MNVVTFLFKMLIVFVVVEMIAAVLPRVRIESAVKFCWTWPMGLALLQMIYTVVTK